MELNMDKYTCVYLKQQPKNILYTYIDNVFGKDTVSKIGHVARDWIDVARGVRGSKRLQIFADVHYWDGSQVLIFLGIGWTLQSSKVHVWMGGQWKILWMPHIQNLLWWAIELAHHLVSWFEPVLYPVFLQHIATQVPALLVD